MPRLADAGSKAGVLGVVPPNAVQRPEQVDRGRPACREVAAHLFKMRREFGRAAAGKIANAEKCTECGGNADRRRAPDHQSLDGIPHLPLIGDLDVDRLHRQASLVEQANTLAGPLNGLQHAKQLYASARAQKITQLAVLSSKAKGTAERGVPFALPGV